jgi:hypothetical protein
MAFNTKNRRMTMITGVPPNGKLLLCVTFSSSVEVMTGKNMSCADLFCGEVL